MNSLRGRTVWFLCFVTLAAGLMTAASEVVHAQSTESFNLSGTVIDKDGAAVEGLSVEASGFPSKFVTRTDGSFDLVFFSFTRGRITVGDEIVLTVTDRDEIVTAATYTVTAADIAAVPPNATVNIQLSGLDSVVSTTTLPADGSSTASITVNIVVAGESVSGDTVTITAEQGTVGDVTDNGDGTYTATYTAPELVLSAPTTDNITIESANTGETSTATVTLVPVPTLISVTATPSSFVAGIDTAGMLNVNVSRGGDPVADAEISISASRADGVTDAGTVGEVTNNGDGSYSAPYSPSNTAGRITIAAADAVSGETASATVSVNAGAPSALAISVNPVEVSSGGSAMITVTVTDDAGNGVGGLTPAGTTGTGSVGDFAEGDDIGSYTATYTAPMVDAVGTDIVTVNVGDLTGITTVNLTPVPPVMVPILVVTGEVNKEDGTGSVPGVNVEVTVNDKDPISTTSDEDGNYSVTLVDPAGNAGSTGDTVTVVVTDPDGDERGSEKIVLTNDDLGDGDSSVVNVDVTTDIGATTSALVVTGAVFREASEIPIDNVFDISVTNTTNGMQVSGMTDANGMYSLTLFNPGAPVGETGDVLTVTASKAGEQVGAVTHTLTSAQVDAGRAVINIPTGIKASTSALVVTGTVYHDDGTIEMGAGLSVTVSSPSRELEAAATTDANGMYDLTFFSPADPVGETGDMLTVSVMQDGAQIGAADYALTSADVDAQRAGVDVSTVAVASTPTLVVTGSVFFLDSEIPVGPNLTVTVMNPETMEDVSGMTDADGMYNITLFSPAAPVAETGDAITVTVMHGEGIAGSITVTLTAAEIDSQRAMADVSTSIKAESAVFNVTGVVYLEDGISPAPPGLTVKVSNVNQGVADEGWTAEDGSYSVTLFSASMSVARSADELTLDVTVLADTAVVGTTSYTLTTDEVVARRISDVDITTSLTADPSNLMVVDGTVTNPDGTPASAGVEVRLTLGSNPTLELQTNAGGGYLTTFFEPLMPIVSVGDSLAIAVLDREAGSAANESMDIASHHVLARRIMFDITLIADDILPVPVAVSSQKFVQKTETVDFDGSGSTDNVGIDTYMWDFGDGNTADTMNASHQYANPGKYLATLTIVDLAGNEASASLDIFVDTVRLGGLSLNTRHSRDVVDKIIKLAIARTDVGMSIGPDALLEMMRANPAMQNAVLDAVTAFLPAGILPKQLLDAEIPVIFNDYENIDLENFGNALTARPGSGPGILETPYGGFTRVITGNKLSLYLAAPRGDVGSVTFRFDGPGYDPLSQVGTQDGREVLAGMTMPHTFQLEEEQAILLLPSWPDLNEGAGAFSSVTLRYAAADLPPEYANLISRARQVPVDPASYVSAPLSPMNINGEIVWSGEVGIEPGKIYYYFYQVELNTPVSILGPDGGPSMLTSYAVVDPRNHQLEDRGILDAFFTMGVQDAIAPFLNPVIDAVTTGRDVSSVNFEELLTGENLGALLGALTGASYPIFMDIMNSMYPQSVSVFTTPMSTESQSVWYTNIDLSNVADGMHTVDANAFDSNGVQIDNRPVYGKTFILDRSAPGIDASVDNGQNSAMYMRDDGVLISTGLITPDPNQMASLILSAGSADITEDLATFMYQIIRHSDDPSAQMTNAWVPLFNPAIAPEIGALSINTFNAYVARMINDLLTLNARSGLPADMLRPHELIIRGANNGPALIVGEYGLRAVGMDDVGNLSSYTAPVRVDIVAPDPDQAVITNITIGDCNKDGDLDDPFESGPPSADSTIFANTLSVKLTVEIPNRTVHPLTGIVVQYKTAHGTAAWKDIATIDAPGDVEWAIADFDALLNGGGDDPRIYVRAVATNALTITDPAPVAPIVKLDAGVCPVQPEHIAVNIVPAGTNDETGGYCGIITVYGYTAARTIPDLASVRFNLTMPDGSSITIGEATESAVFTQLPTDDLVIVLGDLLNLILNEGMGSSAPEATYRKWSITFNTASLVDSLDAPYVVSATMNGADGMEYVPIAGGTDDFLLHNGDVEVGTTITAVADAYGTLEMSDGGYVQLGGITAEGYDTPVAILTADPAAPDWRVDGVHLVAHARNADGSKGDAVDVGEVTVEETVSVEMSDMTKTSSNKIYTITITDLSVLGVGGDYALQVLAHDSKAAPDVEAEDPAFGVAANVDNFTPLPNITIDGRGEGMSLADFMAGHPLGYRIALSDINMFPFSVNAPGVLMGEITVQIDGGTLADDLVMIDGTRHDFSVVASTSATGEGDHPASGTVTKRNGSVGFDLVNLAIDRIPPVITVLSPTEDDEVSSLPTIHAIYNDGAGYGIAVASDDALDVAANVEIQITRLNPPDASGVPVNQDELDDADAEVVYSPDNLLVGGAYRTDVSVTDKWGNRSTAAGEFTVVGTLPSVTILSPMAASVSDDGMPLVSAVITGTGTLDVVFMIDGEAFDAQIDGKNLRYTPESPLAEGEHTVSIQVTDADGKMADASVIFTVEQDHSPPVVTQVSPLGVVWGANVTLSVTAGDDQSGVASVSIALDGGDAVEGASRGVEGLALGQHTATATVTNGDGYSDTYTWTFSIALDEEAPAIGTQSPLGVVRTTTPTVTVGATDLSGIASIEIAVTNSNGDAVDGDTAMDESGTSASLVPAGDLANDTYSVAAVVTDNAGNVASTNWSFTVEASYDTTGPSIDVYSPQGVVRIDMPTISVTASDVSDTAQQGLSGIASIEISVAASNGTAVGGASEYDGASSGRFSPNAGLANDTYTATAVVTDNSGNETSASWNFTVEVVMDEMSPIINATSPQGTIRTNRPRIDVSATDDMSGIASFAIRVVRSDFVRVDGNLTYEGGTKASLTPANALRNDTYSVAVDVTDKAGNVTNVSWSFTVQVDATPPVISTNSPMGIVRDDMPRVSVSAIDDESGVASIEIRVLNSAFQRIGGPHTYEGGTAAAFVPERALPNGTYTVGATATDKAGNSSDATWTFAIEADHTPPTVNSTSPQGIIRDDTPRVSVSATDDISGIANIEIRVLNSAFVRIAGPTTFEGGTVGFFNPTSPMKNDTYTVGVKVTDKAGNTTDADWVFTIEVDEVPPTIGDTGPHGIIRTAQPRVTVSATDDLSGIRSFSIRVVDAAFNRVAGPTTFQGGTFASWSPSAGMANGVYSVGVDVTDKSANVASTGWSFTVEVDTVEPSIVHTSPAGSVRPENPIISVSATDNLSGIASIVISLRDSNQSAVPGRTVFEGGTIGTFVPVGALDYGTHYVGVRVSDKAGNVANATYSFTVESADGVAVLNARNFPNPFAGATKIAFTLTRSSEVSIEIFDISMRPVWNMSRRTIQATREHVIGWDGTTTGGEKLARGVYFCQIMVHDSLNPQYAILKMAIQ
jgi:hypothetical protein